MRGFSPDLAGAATIRNLDLRTHSLYLQSLTLTTPRAPRSAHSGVVLSLQKGEQLSCRIRMSREHVFSRGNQHHPPCRPTLPVISINCVLLVDNSSCRTASTMHVWLATAAVWRSTRGIRWHALPWVSQDKFYPTVKLSVTSNGF